MYVHDSSGRVVGKQPLFQAPGRKRKPPLFKGKPPLFGLFSRSLHTSLHLHTGPRAPVYTRPPTCLKLIKKRGSNAYDL